VSPKKQIPTYGDSNDKSHSQRNTCNVFHNSVLQKRDWKGKRNAIKIKSYINLRFDMFECLNQGFFHSLLQSCFRRTVLTKNPEKNFRCFFPRYLSSESWYVGICFSKLSKSLLQERWSIFLNLVFLISSLISRVGCERKILKTIPAVSLTEFYINQVIWPSILCPIGVSKSRTLHLQKCQNCAFSTLWTSFLEQDIWVKISERNLTYFF